MVEAITLGAEAGSTARAYFESKDKPLLPRTAVACIGCVGCANSVAVELHGPPTALRDAVTTIQTAAELYGAPYTTLTNWGGEQRAASELCDAGTCIPAINGAVDLVRTELSIEV